MRQSLQTLARALLFFLFPAAVMAGGEIVRVVGPAPVADTVVTRLSERLPALSVRRNGGTSAALVIAVGAGAFSAAVQAQGVSGAPVVGIALTRHAWRQVPPGRHTALFWDPDPVRQLRLARAVLPGAHHVGVLLGAEDPLLLAGLRAQAEQLGLELHVAVVGGKDTLPRQLNKVLADSDFLLGIDDPAVFSPALAKTVLLTSYRHDKPVFGPSAAWVEAGSVASLSAGLEDAVDELANWLPRLLNTDKLPPPRHAARYRVVTNPSVARSLQLSLPPASELDALAQEEENRP